MKKIALLVVLLLSPLFTFATQVMVFVSFSMPDNLLQEVLQDSARLQIPAYLNGFYHDSMPETAIKVMRLSQHIPNLNLQIDPTAFERFAIQQVPAGVVENRQGFDVIYGHLNLKENLVRIASRHNDSGLTLQEVRKILHE